MTARERVTFKSDDASCVGYFYRAAAEARPCLVMAHGFGGTQEGSLARNAADFATAGLHVLTFDYRSFGESGGEPRQVIDIPSQHADWRAAISFARSLAQVRPDKVALWGSSLGGGHVLAVAASDPSLAAVVAQVPFNGFPRKVEGRSSAQTRQLLSAAFADWRAGRKGQPPRYIKAVGDRGELAVMASAAAAHTIAMMDNPTWRNEIAPRVLLQMMFYRPGRQARKLAMPLLLALAEWDKETPAELTSPIAEQARRGEIRRYPCSHFQFYDEAVRPVVLADQTSFLRTHLFGFEGLSEPAG